MCHCNSREESGKPDSDLDEPSWIMTVKSPHSIKPPLDETNSVKKVQNGSGPPQPKSTQKDSNLNHYRSDRSIERSERSDRNVERNDRSDRNVERNDRSSERSDRNVERNDRSIERSDRNDRSIERTDRNTERIERFERSSDRSKRNDWTPRTDKSASVSKKIYIIFKYFL